ncbi:uncharacterized protein [Typha angustifolia]|uniref:uncharacterized protein n=1 Tax=Typha angustifolia TaxID=59011 RepID=UPI003C2D6AD4
MGEYISGWPTFRTSTAAQGRTRLPPPPPPPPLSLWTPWPVPHPVEIRPQILWRAEWRAREIAWRIQPATESEKLRKAVIEYVRKLIGASFGCEVLSFGSVPLKTYLPDGDIDLTAFGNSSSGNDLVYNICRVLKTEEHNKDAEFEVKDVQYIHAEVRLVKCLIQNIIVDISFNQIGGLCTLCFLELVDRHIGKDHLFKRSIILIKAWCYYESRILGAHHGLISTYALETLVLYILHLFHKCLNGPLAVLYRFLDYFSKFDWDNYCISLHGPVALSSLPNIVVELPGIDYDDLLLSKEFLKSSVEKFSVPLSKSESKFPNFPRKHLNIIDPLKRNNNLGRSVSRGNFYRIRSAFEYGARKLGWILTLPPELVADELSMFFANTLERHGTGERPDVKHHLSFSSGGLDPIGFTYVPSGLQTWKGGKYNITYVPSSIDLHGELHEELLPSFEKEVIATRHHHAAKMVPAFAKMNSDVRRDGHLDSGIYLAGESPILASNGFLFLRAINEKHMTSPSTQVDASSSTVHYASHPLYYPEYSVRYDRTNSTDYRTKGEVSHISSQVQDVESNLFRQPQLYQNDFVGHLTSSSPSSYMKSVSPGPARPAVASRWNYYSSEYSHLRNLSLARKGLHGTVTNLALLNRSDLAGDLDSHLRCLRQVQYNFEYMFGGFFQSVDQTSSTQPHDKCPIGGPSRLSVLSHREEDRLLPGLLFSSPTVANPVKTSPGADPVNSSPGSDPVNSSPGAGPVKSSRGTDPVNSSLSTGSVKSAPISSSISAKDLQKQRQTSIDSPIPRFPTYKERLTSREGKNSIHADQLSRTRNNGIFLDKKSEKMWQELPPIQQIQIVPYNGSSRQKPPLMEASQSSPLVIDGSSQEDDLIMQAEDRVEFGSFGPVPLRAFSTESWREFSVVPPNSGSVIAPASPLESSRLHPNHERTKQTYQLKDDADFPPLRGMTRSIG